jgi:starch phosphorylase
MLLHDPERLVHISTNRDRPVQLIIAGKAHPQDGAGQAMIKRWNEFLRRPEVRGHAVFLSDYDMLMTQKLVEGVDVWINTPRRPWEASGTSGMKVLANGGLNLSELDGWWAEAYSSDVGWAIGDGRDRGDDFNWDAVEANVLYALLEQEIIPTFYDRDQQGIPRRWVAKIRESMARLTPAFSANRAVRQYTENHYIPLASAYCARAANGGEAGAGLLTWLREFRSYWQDLHFGSVAITARDGKYFFSVQVHLGRLKREDVRIEIYADPLNSGRPFCAPMTFVRVVPNEPGNYEYTAAVPSSRPAHHYTPRAIPYHQNAFIPLEIPLITWQK